MYEAGVIVNEVENRFSCNVFVISAPIKQCKYSRWGPFCDVFLVLV